MTITSVVEDQIEHIPPQFFFPEATAEHVAAHEWLRPEFGDDAGNITMRIQAFVVEVDGRTILVDPCVGNGKTSALPFWHDQHWPWFERFGDAGYTTAAIDTVVHTHLHLDHIGWDTHRVGDGWVPTFTSARHLYTQAQLDWLRDPSMDNEHGLRESVQPVLDTGLGDVVAPDADLGSGLRLAPSYGHTPGHVSLWIESAGEVGLISGDFLHHPVQCAELDWAEIGDSDPDEARATRRRMLAEAADRSALFLGTHFPNRCGGRVVRHADAYRFVPDG